MHDDTRRRSRDESDADHEANREPAKPSEGLPLPFAPDPDDDSPLGDTDQHSDA